MQIYEIFATEIHYLFQSAYTVTHNFWHRNPLNSDNSYKLLRINPRNQIFFASNLNCGARSQ